MYIKVVSLVGIPVAGKTHSSKIFRYVFLLKEWGEQRSRSPDKEQ
jgi:hypothetical protein